MTTHTYSKPRHSFWTAGAVTFNCEYYLVSKYPIATNAIPTTTLART